MKRLITASVTLAVFVPAAAQAQSPSPRHFGVYRYVYRHARAKFGANAVGCELRYVCHGQVTEAKVLASTQTLERMLYPPPLPAPTVSSSRTTTTTTTSTPTAAPAGGLAACIVAHESGGNPTATNGQYGGIGQWSPDAWAQDGGTQYAPSPTQASAAQQMAVLNGEGAAGMAQQQGQYDGCS